MAQETLQNVFDAARSWLADNIAVSAGESYTNALLQPHFATAYRKLYDAMGNLGSFRVVRFFYYNLPAYTTMLVPVAIGVTDMAEPNTVAERGGVTSVAITSTNTATPIQVTTAAPHNLASNSSDIVISGVASTTSPWGRWFVTVVDPTNFTLNGSVSDGNAGTGGTVSVATEKFSELSSLDEATDRDLSDHLQDYQWEESVLKFRGATQLRQIRVEYTASGTAPSSAGTVIAIDNALNFLGCYTAALACGSRGWTQMRDYLRDLSLGPGADGSKGFLRDFVNIQVKKLAARNQRRRMPFRRKRLTQDTVFY